MKKLLVLLVSVLLVIGEMTGCAAPKTDTGKLSIVTTIFPEYDWVGKIIGTGNKNVELTMLLDNGVDLHSYQPTVQDIARISTCDLFIYVGGESEGWVENALAESTNGELKVINLLEVLGDSAKTEEMVEGMQESTHDHEEGEDSDHEEEEEEYDEHVWLSLKNAEIFCRTIADTLGSIDSQNADSYQANAAAYIAELNALDSEYQTVVDAAPVKTVLFGDRFPFRYLVDDYGLDYYAAFVGCSAETEASFAMITFLSGKVDELGLNAVLTIENPRHTIAETIVNNTVNKNAQILSMDSMQSTTSKDVESGTTYLSIMKANLDILKSALQ